MTDFVALCTVTLHVLALQKNAATLKPGLVVIESTLLTPLCRESLTGFEAETVHPVYAIKMRVYATPALLCRMMHVVVESKAEMC